MLDYVLYIFHIYIDGGRISMLFAGHTYGGKNSILFAGRTYVGLYVLYIFV